MSNKYVAVTVDVCEHESLHEEMNVYMLDPAMDLAEQVAQYAKTDVASLVKLYKFSLTDKERWKLEKEYRFDAYTCSCGTSS